MLINFIHDKDPKVKYMAHLDGSFAQNVLGPGGCSFVGKGH